MADEETLREIDILNNNLTAWEEFTRAEQTLPDFDIIMESVIRDILYQEFKDAMEQIPEYATYDPLKDHLLDNVWFGPHVIVKNGVIIQIFDEDYAGTEEDLRAGQIAAGADFSRHPIVRSIGWQIIYNAAFYGIAVEHWNRVDDNTYGEIIDARLASWGEKAPYWLFVEYGTASGSGPGRPYPNFSGKHPILKTAKKAESLVKEALRSRLDAVERELSEQLDTTFTERKVTVQEIGEQVVTAWTKWFRQHGKDIRLEYRKVGGGFTGERQEAPLGTYTE